MTSHHDEIMTFYFAYHTFTETADEILSEFGLRRQHHRFLFFIARREGMSLKELIKVLEISKQGSHKTLQDLKLQGYIIERNNEQDRRVKHLYLTRKGKLLEQKLTEAQSKRMAQIFDKVGHDWFEVMHEYANERQGYRDFVENLMQKSPHYKEDE
ncbi:MarR family winged helix-turn-helix transcriptional regulator [Abyssicoccus albus]|jgi:DNA-binding MarR family transcriptional regulator|uniref:Transcriptional regulator n=1 Tax=Abyssicoccus albus TaxID=1817405 RepID=A0A1Q1FZI5_9BACL|nr:MarR family transcriptional regulator [Abyssicoccus albus]AQL55509.1 hypothetical protein BVH56_00390 [Abyssicoccus albus]RPF56632.1 transcriptional regulator [Abyssicoccus albus]